MSTLLPLVWNPAKTPDINPRRSASAADPGTGIATNADDLVSYWGDLIDRLKLNHGPLVAATQVSGPGCDPQPSPARAQPGVQDFIAIIEQMYADLKESIKQRQQLERQVSDVRTAAACTQHALISAKARERSARHAADHDSLTKLPNARLFRERLQQSLAQASCQALPVVVMYIDLDGFKKINDRNGHEAGDALLKVIAARLARAVRAEDLVCRLGGDEFACLFPHVEPRRKQLDRIATKLYEAVSAPCRIGSDSLTIRPSIGIATYPADGKSAKMLLKKADSAMYRAKATQVGYEYFNPEAYA